MAGTFDKPERKSAAVTEWLDLARLVLDANLTETTQAHRDDGFQGAEAADPEEFSYIHQRLRDWLIRNGVTLVGEHRTATITVGGAVTTGDTRRLSVTSPAAFVTDYTTQASDASNNDIASNWAASINDNANAQLYLTASASGADVTVEWLTGLEAVSWSASVTVSVGAPTAVLTEVVSGDLYMRPADDDTLSGLLVGSASTEDIGGTSGDLRMFYDRSTGSFRAGWCTGTEWDSGSRGTASTALGKDTTASGDYSHAGGQGSTAAGDHALAHGNAASADFASAIALGDGATVNGIDGVALGNAAQATSSGVGIGPSAVSGVSGGVAIGNGAQAGVGGTDGVAIGKSASETGTEAMALGSGAFSGGDYALSAGKDASAPNDYATAIGYSSTASGDGAVAIGHKVDATAAGALAIAATSTPASATGATASATGAIAIGVGSSTSADKTISSAAAGVAIGKGCETSAAGLAVGDYAIAREEGVFALSAQPIKTTPTPLDADRGSAQAGTVVKVSQTTDGSTVVLGGAASTIEVPSGRAIHMIGEVVAMNGTDSLTSAWAVEILARNVGGTVTGATLTSSTSTGDAPGGTTAVANPAVVAGVGVKIDVTGTAGKNINWIGHFRFAEIAIP